MTDVDAGLLVARMYDVRIKFEEWDLHRLAGEPVPYATPPELSCLRSLDWCDHEYPNWMEQERLRRRGQS